MDVRLSKLTICLHWLIGISIIMLIAVGYYMSSTHNYDLYYYHKSIGVIVLLLAAARIIWRIYEGWPTPNPDHANWEQKLSKLIHWVLILSTLAIPISGIMYSGAGGFGVHIFDWIIIPPNPSPEDATKMIPYHETLYRLGVFGHTKLIYIPLAALILHILGALKHHYQDKDSTLVRILGKD